MVGREEGGGMFTKLQSELQMFSSQTFCPSAAEVNLLSPPRPDCEVWEWGCGGCEAVRQCGGTGTICGRIMSDVGVEWHVSPGPRQLSSPLTLLCIDLAVVRPGRPGGVITISALNCSSYHTRPHHTAATLLLLVGINHSCLPRLRGGGREGGRKVSPPINISHWAGM